MIKWHPSKQQVQLVCTIKLAVIITKDYERILIGQQNEILDRLEGREYASVDYDETRPFGTFLLSGEHDNISWRKVVFNLRRAQEIFLSPTFKQLTMDQPQIYEREAWSILNKKYDTGDPICRFVAMRIWHKYWAIRGKRDTEACREFFDWAQNFVRPFARQYQVATYPKSVDSKNPIFRKTRCFDASDRMSYIYSLPKGDEECLLIKDSLIPLERFYERKIEKWTKYLICCNICGKYFMADSLQYKLCSDSCKWEAQKRTRERRREDDQTVRVERPMAAANGHWNSRLKKIRKSPEWSEELVAKYREAMVQFQAEKRKKRSSYKKGEISYGEFMDWLYQKQEEAERVLQELKEQKNL